MGRFEEMIEERPGNNIVVSTFSVFLHCVVSYEYPLTFSDKRFFSIDEISSEIFDTLACMGDFEEFKEMMINLKKMNSRSQKLDLSLTGKHVA